MFQVTELTTAKTYLHFLSRLFKSQPTVWQLTWPLPFVQNMSQDQWESVAVSVESLLSDARRMQVQCRERSEQLSTAATQLRVESAALREQCEASQLDMVRIRRQLDELLDTKAAFEARERQARKLSKQLWGNERNGLLIYCTLEIVMMRRKEEGRNKMPPEPKLYNSHGKLIWTCIDHKMMLNNKENIKSRFKSCFLSIECTKILSFFAIY